MRPANTHIQTHTHTQAHRVKISLFTPEALTYGQTYRRRDCLLRQTEPDSSISLRHSQLHSKHE